MQATPLAPGTRIETDLPPRLDRLPWAGWHWRVVIALGITWILDGLEVTLVGAIAGVLADPATLGLTPSQIGLAASAYLGGAIAGALFFGRLTDRLGRKRLFLITLGVYLVATLATAASWDFWSFALCRAVTGFGIGGECSAMNSAIDELIPARVRGRVDLMINGTYWVGTALGAASTLWLLDPSILPITIGWRMAFALGGILGAGVLMVRRHLPESPRWLLLHGRVDEAARTVRRIEKIVAHESGRPLPAPGPPVNLEVKGTVGLAHVARVLLVAHRRRTVLGVTLMASQAFAYNAIFFTYALVLGRFYGVAPDRVGLYILPFAVGNALGPLILGHLFDSVGRRPMIAITYAVSGLLLALTGWLFARGLLTATTQTLLWSAVFFVASAAASSAYLTVSELFPVELRGLAIALFYVAGLAAGGVAAPAILGALIESGDRYHVFAGYLVGAALMVTAAVLAAFIGVPAERKSLEEIAALRDGAPSPA
jgi:MFS family permease